jgi:predicted ester cyclase
VNDGDLVSFATRYAEAWCSQSPERVASFHVENGSLTINNGAPNVGRRAIMQVAQAFMRDFPDLRVMTDKVFREGERTFFHWTLTGTKTGPGGTGKKVCINGYEIWRFSEGGLIAESHGHFDAVEYARQLGEGVEN